MTEQPDPKPTASEFIPADEVYNHGQPMLRTLEASDDGVEIVAHEPYNDEVEFHIFICDQCGHDESTADGIAHHLEHNH